MKKKILSILLATSMMLSLVACTESTGTSEEVSGVTMPDYLNLEVPDVELIEVSDTDVQSYIDYMLSANAQSTEVTDRAVQEGDTVNIDYVGLLDDVAFDGGTAEAQDLVIGSDTYIDGFEDGLIGYNVGDELDLAVTFPEDYGSDELNGQDVIFQVTINSITESITPEFTDEFVQEISTTCTTTDEYYAEIYAMYEADNLATQESSRELQLWSTLIAATVVDEFPEDEITALEEEVSAYYETYATYYGMTIDEFVEASGLTMDEYAVVITDTAEEIYTSEVVVNYIAEQEGLGLTDEEYQAEIDAIVTLYGYESEDALYEETSRESLEMDVLTDVVMAWLMENVTFVESVATEEVTEEVTE